MNPEVLRDYCLSKKGVTESFPFDNETLVFKVMHKLFLLVSLDTKPLRFNVKCDPELAIALREQYGEVYPAYHMNKKHWNSVVCTGDIPDSVLLGMIDHSYELVVKGLSKSLQNRLNSL